MVTVEAEQSRMNMAGIREKAEAVGINPGKLKKNELIHSIQIEEGCLPCFGRSDGHCVHTDCCYRKDCLKDSLTECRRSERELREQVGELVAKNEQFQNQIIGYESAENELRQYRDQIEQRLAEQTSELGITNEKLQKACADYQQEQNEFQRYRDKFQKHLTTVNEQLQQEIAKREHAEEKLDQVRSKLDNANYVLQQYLDSENKKCKELSLPVSGLTGLAELCGRICGLLSNAFVR